jgi:pyruvate dehydrogenase E2 component (dihydrolipoamide acetyltransferase)
MPALSSTMTEGKIVSWLKSEGDRLSKGDSVVVVESDKADMDVESFHDGILAAIVVPEGSSAPVGSPIALLAETEDEIVLAKSQASGSSSAAPASDQKTEDVSVPVAEPEPAPPTPPVSSRVSTPAMKVASTHPASEGGKRIVATPYAKKLAKEFNVDLATVVGSGPMGRIVAKDVELAASSAVVSEKPMVGTPAAAPAVQLGSVVPFTTMQGAVSRNMLESLSVPTFRVGYTITTVALDTLYKKVKYYSGVFFLQPGYL